MYALLIDALAALRLRFAPAEHYRYPWPVLLAAVVLLGVIHAAGIAPVFGSSPGAVAFSVLLMGLKWLLLARMMALVVQYYGSPKHSLLGFVAATEVLALPQLALLYWPDELGLVVRIWYSWIIVVQLLGFGRLSGQGMLKVLLGYLAFWAAFLVAAMLLLLLFAATGLLDVEAIGQQVQQILAQPQP